MIKAKFMRPNDGWKHDIERAKKYGLVVGEEYEVIDAVVHSAHTDVNLVGFREPFNSVQFDYYENDVKIDIVEEYMWTFDRNLQKGNREKKEKGEDGMDIKNAVEDKDEAVDMINHPPHYTRDGGMECIDEMILIFGKKEAASFCKLNSWKYRARAPYKGNPEQDMQKSNWYLKKYKELKEELDSSAASITYNNYQPGIALTNN